MLGFGGHFATKSRAYSTTFGALCQERADFTARRDPLTAALADNPDVLVINHWSFGGREDTSRVLPRVTKAVAKPEAGSFEGDMPWTT